MLPPPPPPAFPVNLTPLSRNNFVLWVEPLYIIFQGSPPPPPPPPPDPLVPTAVNSPMVSGWVGDCLGTP